MMQAHRGSVISPSKATTDLQASRPSWKAGRQLGHAFDQQVSSLTWYQVDQVTDKCWLALGPPGESKSMHVHHSSPHFTADISAITGIKWSQRCQSLATPTLKAVIFPASWHGQRLMEDLASRTCLSPRIQRISLDDPWMIPG